MHQKSHKNNVGHSEKSRTCVSISVNYMQPFWVNSLFSEQRGGKVLATYPVILAGQDIIQPLIEVSVWGEADVIKHRPATQHSRHSLGSKQHSYVIEFFFFKARKELFADLLFPPCRVTAHASERLLLLGFAKGQWNESTTS